MAGSKTVRVTFNNDYWDEVRGDRNVRLDRLDLRNAAGQVITHYELERLEPVTDCNHPVNNHFALHCGGSVDIPIEISTAGNYVIEIVVWADQAGDDLPKLSVSVESNVEGSAGATSIRNKLVELHDRLLGVQVAPHSPEVEAAYRLYVDVWQRGHASGDDWFNIWDCQFQHDIFFFEGILDDIIVEQVHEHGHRWYGLDQERYNNFLRGIDFSDPYYTAQAWVAVLAAMMMDYRYLYL